MHVYMYMYTHKYRYTYMYMYIYIHTHKYACTPYIHAMFTCLSYIQNLHIHISVYIHMHIYTLLPACLGESPLASSSVVPRG